MSLSLEYNDYIVSLYENSSKLVQNPSFCFKKKVLQKCYRRAKNRIKFIFGQHTLLIQCSMPVKKDSTPRSTKRLLTNYIDQIVYQR